MPLNSDPSYETLSYVWGDQSHTRQITCDGSPRTITESLFLALSRLRLRDKPRTVWIDQLCIDQTNHVEESRQVSVMRDIYRKARQGLIWLGDLLIEEQAGFSESHVAIAVLGSVNYLLNYRQLSDAEYDEHTLQTINLWSSVFDDSLGDRSIDELYTGNEAMTCLEAFCRVLIGDLVYNISEPNHRASQEDVSRVQNYVRGGWDPNIAASARDMARSQAFFVTEAGYFGIGPPDADIGDEVWIMLCGNVPHVIRRRGEQAL